MRIPRYIALGLAWFSLASCLGASAWPQNHAAAAATDPLGNINRLPGGLEQRVRLLSTDLQAKGFAVARGYWTLWGWKTASIRSRPSATVTVIIQRRHTCSRLCPCGGTSMWTRSSITY